MEVGLQLVTFLLVKPSLQTNKQAKNVEIVQMIIKSTTVNPEDQLSLQLDHSWTLLMQLHLQTVTTDFQIQFV